MKFTEFKDKNIADLEKLLKEKRLNLFTLKAKLKTMQLKNTHEIKENRRTIAKILTAIQAKRNANDS